MLQLIKADLIGILTLFAEYRPQLDRNSLEVDIRTLERSEDRDFLFLARREKCYLFPISQVYQLDSYAYLCWTAYLNRDYLRVDALYLHRTDTVNGWPLGTVTVLDYTASARDVERFAMPTEQSAAPHIQRIIEHYRYHARIGSTLDFISAVKNTVEFYS